MFYAPNTDPKTRDKYPWRVIKTQSFQTPIYGFDYIHKYFAITKAGVVTVFKDYLCNGNTGLPLWIERRWLACMIAGSIVHDVLYQLISMGILPLATRALADQVLYWRWIADKTPKAIADFGYAVVSRLGGFFIKKQERGSHANT